MPARMTWATRLAEWLNETPRAPYLCVTVPADDMPPKSTYRYSVFTVHLLASAYSPPPPRAQPNSVFDVDPVSDAAYAVSVNVLSYFSLVTLPTTNRY